MCSSLLQIKILKILAELGRDDKKSSENMYTVLADVMRRGNTGHTIGNAVVYECVRVITAIHPNTALLQVSPPFPSPSHRHHAGDQITRKTGSPVSGGGYPREGLARCLQVCLERSGLSGIVFCSQQQRWLGHSCAAPLTT